MAAPSSPNRGSRIKKSQETPEQVVVEAIFRILWRLISWPFRRNKPAASKTGIPAVLAFQLGSHWSTVEGYLGSPTTFGLAVSEADKLFDAALQAAGVPGKNLGERLQQASALFPKALYEEIWQAHKLRNTLAHELGVAPNTAEVYQAIQAFQSGLRELGVAV